MMKKFSYILFFVFCSLPLCAQHGPKTALAAREALAKTLPQTAAKQASASLLKALPAHASRLTAQTALPGYRISVPAEPEHAALYQRLERRLRQAVVLSPADRIYNEHTREALIKPFPAPQPPYQLEDWERFSQQEVAAYFALYRDMREFHTYLVQKMVPLLSYFRPGKLAPEEKQLLADQISSFRQRIDQQLSKMVSLDAALARMLTDMNLAMEVMFDMKGQLVPHRIQRQKPFDENTFRLLPPEQAAPRLAVRDEKNLFSSAQALRTAQTLCAQLPADLHIAVLNDDPANTRQYERWQQAGAFSNGLSFTHFSSVNQFLASVKSGHPFDLILTDYYIPGGGGDFLVKILREQHDDTPILFHSYSGGNTSAWQKPRNEAFLKRLYETGYDGYLPTNDDFFTNRGHLYVLEGLRNFFLTR